MAHPVASDQAEPAVRGRFWTIVGMTLDRVGRWLVFSVILGAIPVLISLAFLNKGASPTSLLSHGDFAVIASALAGASMQELLGPDEPAKLLRNILLSACILLFAGSIILLGSIAGDSAQLSLSQKANYSWLLFTIAVIIGVASMGLTVHRPPAKRSHVHHESNGPEPSIEMEDERE